MIKWRTTLGTIPGLAAQGIKDTGSVRPRNGPVVAAGGLIFVGTEETVTSTPSTRTLEKSFGKPSSKETLTEFQRYTRLTGADTWSFTRPAAAGMGSS